MHVLVLPSWFEDVQHPTLGSFFKDQARALASRGNTVGMIYPIPISLKGIQHYQPVNHYSDEPNKIHILTQSYFTIPALRQLNICRRLRQYQLLFKRYTAIYGLPDVLHAHSCALGPAGSAGLAAHLISTQYDIPYVITEHGSAFHTGYYNKKDVTPILRAFANASAIVAVSNSLKTDLRDFGVTSNIQVLGNIVDVDAFRPLSFISSNSCTYTFIAVAYLRPIKQIDILIKAFAKIHLDNPALRLKIVGDGEQKLELQKLSIKLALENVIEFCGEASRSELASILSSSDCLVLTSQYETFAVVAHEALAAGKPVISFACGGPEPTLRVLGETILCNHNVDELATAMLTQSKKTETPEKAQQRSDYIVRHFSANTIGVVLENYLTDIFNEKILP